MKFKTYTMEDVLEVIIDYRGKTPQKSDSGIPTLSAKSVKNNYIDYSLCYYISPDEYKRFMVHGFPKVGDVLLTTEAPMGVVARLDRDDVAIAQRLLTLRGRENILDNEYLLYYLQSSIGQSLLKARETGTTVTGIKQAEFKKIQINVPEIGIQKKIGRLLRALDEKIEINNKINNNLEQQAQTIFKSWFVDFEPFGNERPSEMQFVPLQDLCKVVTKGTTPTTLGKPFTTSGINFIKAESILDNHSIDNTKFAYIDDETNTMLKRSIIESGDIVFTIAGTLGRFALIDESVLPANTNQAVAIIRPDTNKVAISYLYSFFIGNWHNDYYTKRVQQAVQANLSLTTIKSLPIAILSNESMKKYDDLVRPLFAMMKNNEEENRKLSNLRDTLLPKLMSGELDVSNIDL